MSGEMRQNVSKKGIKGGGKKRKRTCRKRLGGFFLVSRRQQLLRCLLLHCSGGGFPQFDVWSLNIFLGMFGPEQVHLQIRKHSLKREREREKRRRWSEAAVCYRVMSVFMSTCLTVSAACCTGVNPEQLKEAYVAHKWNKSHTLHIREWREREAFTRSPRSRLYLRHLGRS